MSDPLADMLTRIRNAGMVRYEKKAISMIIKSSRITSRASSELN
jgi:ribosomal protein S8